MRGVGVVFSRYLEVDTYRSNNWDGNCFILCCSWRYERHYLYSSCSIYCINFCIHGFCHIHLLLVTGYVVPQLIGASGSDGVLLLEKLDGLHKELGFHEYTSGSKSIVDVFCITMALMVELGLPHVIVRFFNVKKVSDARKSAGWALLFIAILYTMAPAIAVFSDHPLNAHQTL